MPIDEYLSQYGGGKPFPGLAGKYEGKNLVICGDAYGVWHDLEAFGCRSDKGRGRVEKNEWQFMTVNKMVATFPGNIEHAYSNEGHILQKYIEARRPEYRKEFSGPAHAHSCNRGVKHKWPFGGHGTSGLGACLVAIGLGYDRIVLCGIPLDNGPHNGEPHWRNCKFETAEAASPKDHPEKPSMHWARAIQYAFDGKVTSMSGRTRDWLGTPSLS